MDPGPTLPTRASKETLIAKAIELVENSTLDSTVKLDLVLLLLLDEKEGAQLGYFRVADSEDEKRKAFYELGKELANTTALLDELGLPHELTEKLADKNNIVGFSMLAVKDRKVLQRFILAERKLDHNTMGKILGYPKTAVSAHGVYDRFNFEVELRPEEYKKLKAERIFPFFLFLPSREHWREELEWARANKRLVEKYAPKLYQELIKKQDI